MLLDWIHEVARQHRDVCNRLLGQENCGGAAAVNHVLVDAGDGFDPLVAADRRTGQLVVGADTPQLAIPLVMAGVRTAAVQVVATATLAALVGYGGLGLLILRGLRTRDDVEVFAAALAVAVLALVTEIVLAVVQRALTPRGIRRNAGIPALAPVTDPNI